ncbi:hypothetical protein NCCP2222_29650 [Sporosarcina sp. NCCP-2222]|uniref:hypothetical protein n=1 Tax=Sporosarcina sp. NCCP-2222 TaxID=2935073 RepID=UPI00208CBDE1|nr:hypothetical protein [Sporosarcina sp. NCCP-2222]GKV57018.1 hypothetical protein NCCP2222_29650 [Sporosarcina sp. NCCP-2222]
MNYIFIVNDIKGEKEIKGENIIEHLLDIKYWLFRDTYPLGNRVKKLEKGDMILCYMAGHHRKYFVASFVIESEARDIDEISGLDDIFYDIFKFAIRIKDVRKFAPPIIIYPLINDLAFIKNKAHWGIFFRQSIKSICKNDYKTIVNSQKKSSN